MSASFFSLVYTDCHLAFSHLPTAFYVLGRFLYRMLLTFFCLPFVGQFIIVLLYLLFIFCPQSFLLPSYRLPVPYVRVLSILSFMTIMFVGIPFYIHSYGHHCASSILSSVIMFPFIFLHMGIIIGLIVIPSIRVRVPCPRDKKSEKQEGNEVQM